MLLGDPRQSDQRTQSFHFPIVVHQSLDPVAQSSAQAPSSLSLHALRSSSARQGGGEKKIAPTATKISFFVAVGAIFFSPLPCSTGSERVNALGPRAVEVIICMITRDFSVISMTSQASLSLPLTKVTDAQYRKRFRASYNCFEFTLFFCHWIRMFLCQSISPSAVMIELRLVFGGFERMKQPRSVPESGGFRRRTVFLRTSTSVRPCSVVKRPKGHSHLKVLQPPHIGCEFNRWHDCRSFGCSGKCP